MTSISVHPSGRLALSTSRDGTLRLWNLVKGKCAHTLVLDDPADQVVFSPDGRSYGIVTASKVTLGQLKEDHTGSMNATWPICWYNTQL